MNLDVGQENQASLQLLLNIGLFFRGHAVPLVDGNHQRTSGFENEADLMQILIHNAFTRVDDEDDDVGILDRLQRFDDGKLLYSFLDVLAAAHASGVDQRVRRAVTLIRNVDAVARGAGLVEHHDPFFTEHAVNQRRFADIRTTDNSNAAAIIGLLFLDRHVEVSEYFFLQRRNAAILRRGGQNDRFKAQFEKVIGGSIVIQTVDLVDHQMAGLAG